MARTRKERNWIREKLQPDPPDTIAYRRIKVRKRGGGERLITIAIRRGRGPRGGRTVAVSIRRPRRSSRR
jgi:hypothetical protein